jgi:hypothetical protein
MKTFIHTLLISFVFSLFSAANADDKEKILVHFTGFVKKPGSYQVATKMTMQEIRDACGGLSEFATTKRMMIIRFPRPEGDHWTDNQYIDPWGRPYVFDLSLSDHASLVMLSELSLDAGACDIHCFSFFST